MANLIFCGNEKGERILKSIQKTSLKARNLKCFSDAPQGFEEIKPINIIIGRNNSGKSTLIDLIEHACSSTDISALGHKGNDPQILFSWPLDNDSIAKYLGGSEVELQTETARWHFHPQYWARKNLIDKLLTWELCQNKSWEFYEAEDFDDQNARERKQLHFAAKVIRQYISNPFENYNFRRILADRDISQEKNEDDLKIQSNGSGLTNVIQSYINKTELDQSLVEQDLLCDLNAIFSPDACFSRIIIQKHISDKWEIFLEEQSKGRIPMSDTGSGLKTVLLVLANLLLEPKLSKEANSISNYVFGFEELENNLHPAILRRLFLYLRDKALVEGCYFFITTHSSAASSYDFGVE